MKKRTGYVYVLHFDAKLAGHAQHYIGCTCDPRQRLVTHATGRGAKITQAALAQGIGFRLAALGTCQPAVMHRLERNLKGYKGCEMHCELCTDAPKAIPGTVPYSLDAIEWPTHSDALAKLAPAMETIQVRLCTSADPLSVGEAIRALMKPSKDALGFIPVGGDAGITVSLVNGRVALALMGPVLVGYCAFTEDETWVTIAQAVVSDPLRGCGIGRRLVECIRQSRREKGVRCKVRDDLPANAFWRAIGFVQHGSDIHGTSGQRLNVYAAQAVAYQVGAKAA